MLIKPKMISRREAMLANLSRYYTGKPCVRGHDSQRFTASGSCCDCQYKRQGGRKLAEKELAKLHAAAGLTHRFLVAHDDDWTVLEALAADMMAARIAVYYAANPPHMATDGPAALPGAPTMEPR